MKKSLVSFALYAVLCLTVFAQVAVRGYTRKDGTYVRPHVRTSPDSSVYNNRSYSSGSKIGSGSYYGAGLEYKPSQPITPVRVSSPSIYQPVHVREYKAPPLRPTPSGNENKSQVDVRGYYRSNGTYVQPYIRSAPNKTDDDNWSTKGNINLDTGKPGYRKNDTTK